MYGDSVYYNPDKYGLVVVGELEWAEPEYSFDTTVVWKDSEGQYYMASDSGCSCPSPFEDYISVESLEGPYDRNALEYNLRAEVGDRGNSGYGYGFAQMTNELNILLRGL